MPAETYIISSSIISSNCVVKNDEVIFTSETRDVQSFLLQAYQFLRTDYPKFYKMDMLCRLGWLASEVLLKDEVIIRETKPDKVGIVLTNANASLDTDERYIQSIKDIASPALFVYTLPNIMMGEICIRNGFKGETSFFVFDAFNARFLQRYVSGLFNSNTVQFCICGWIDVLNEDYKAALFLVASEPQKERLLFTEENMNTLFNSIG